MPLPTLNSLFYDAQLACQLRPAGPISPQQHSDTQLALRLLGADALQSEDPVLLRIEAKLDVCLAWLGRVSHANRPSRPCRIGLEQFAWASQPEDQDGPALLEVYPSVDCPLPLTLAVSIQRQPDGYTLATFTPELDEQSASCWSRFVFQQHRRQRSRA